MVNLTPKQKANEFRHIIKTCVAVLETVPDDYTIQVLAYINAMMLIPYHEEDDPTFSVIRISELTEAFYAQMVAGEIIDV